MIIVSDLDGTLSDDSQRWHFVEEGDVVSFFDNSDNDPINKPGKELLDAILENSKGQELLIEILTARSEKYKNHNNKIINYKKRTAKWLKNNGIEVDNINMRQPGCLEDSGTDKLNRLMHIVIDHLEDRKIYYLENDPDMAYAAKDRFPTIHVYLVSYHDYIEI